MPPWNSVSELSVIIMLTVIDLQFSACKSYYFVVVVCVFSWSHQSCWVILSYAATPSHCGCIQSQSNQSSFDFQTPLCAHTRPLRTGGVLKHRELWKLTESHHVYIYIIYNNYNCESLFRIINIKLFSIRVHQIHQYVFLWVALRPMAPTRVSLKIGSPQKFDGLS